MRERVMHGLGISEDEFASVVEDEHGTPLKVEGKPSVTRGDELIQEFLGPMVSNRTFLIFYIDVTTCAREPGESGESRDGYHCEEPEKLSLDPPESDGDHQEVRAEITDEIPANPSDQQGIDSRPDARKSSINLNRLKILGSPSSTKKRCRVALGNLPEFACNIVYFVKTVEAEIIRHPRTIEPQNMGFDLECGYLVGDCLNNLSAAIREVFCSLLDQQLGLGVPNTGFVAGSGTVSNMSTLPEEPPRVGDGLRNDFRTNLHRFESQVSHATRQVKGDINLLVPDINPEDPSIGDDFEAVSLLESSVEEWSRLVATVVEAENLKRVKGKGPIAEIDFWRRRNASLSALYEQINMPKVSINVFVFSRSHKKGAQHTEEPGASPARVAIHSCIHLQDKNYRGLLLSSIPLNMMQRPKKHFY